MHEIPKHKSATIIVWNVVEGMNISRIIVGYLSEIRSNEILNY